MSIKTARTYDTGKVEDVRELKKVLKRSADRLPAMGIARIAAKIKNGERFKVTIPQSIDGDLYNRNRKAKRKASQKSRRTNRKRR